MWTSTVLGNIPKDVYYFLSPLKDQNNHLNNNTVFRNTKDTESFPYLLLTETTPGIQWNISASGWSQ